MSWYSRYKCPFIRLSLRHNANSQTYGRLSRTSIYQGLGCLHLSNPPHAYISYILGPDWRSRLVTPPEHYLNTKSTRRSKNDHSKVPGYSYIPVPYDDDNHNEDEHYLRMKRCEARLVVPNDDSWLEAQDQPIQAGEKQIFGWPSAGGVWVYWIPPAGLRLDPGYYNEHDWLETAIRYMEQGEPEREALDALQLEIRAQTHMEGVCGVLKNAGAMYYENIEECPEVSELGL